MRVHLYGNVCNNAYVIAKFLRRAGTDAHLFIERGFAWLPEHEDPELHGDYPEWIHVVGDLRWRRYGIFDGQIVRALRDCDIVHTFYYGPIWARETGRPYVFHTYGGDLTVLPFMTDSFHHRYLAFRQRHAIQDADAVFVPNPKGSLFREAIRRLRLQRVECMAVPIDTARFRPLPASEVSDERARYDAEWLLFHPSRQIWTDRSAVWERKGNDRFFRAFARFLRTTGIRAVAIAVKHGTDWRESQRLVSDLGLGASVQWISPLSRQELVTFYNLADVVVDQFSLGLYGGCAFEAWSCGKPVMVYLESYREMFREEPPAINVRTEEEIYQKLLELVQSPAIASDIGVRARRWVLENLSGEVLVSRYLESYRRAESERRQPAGD